MLWLLFILHTFTSWAISAASTAAASAPFFFLFVHAIQNKTSVSKYNRKNQNIYHSLSPSFCFFSNRRHHLFPDIPQFLKSYAPDNSSKKAPFPHNLFHLSSILLQSCFKINFKAASNKFQFTLKYILSYQPYSLFRTKNLACEILRLRRVALATYFFFAAVRSYAERFLCYGTLRSNFL